MFPMQDEDVKKIWASILKIMKDYNYQNNVSLEDELEEYINWCKEYHKHYLIHT